MSGSAYQLTDLGTDRAHPARIYDVFLGGKTNYAADRAMADAVAQKMPTVKTAAVANRRFVLRAVRHLAGQAGIRQFLDIGTGIPTSPNLHEVAQGTAPEARVVYVDNDPIVLAHSRALHVTNPAGRTTYLQADFTDPDSILTAPRLHDTIDLTQPVALTMGLLLHWIDPKDEPHAIVRRLVDALPVGSYLVISVFARELAGRSASLHDDFAAEDTALRSLGRDETLAFFDGTELVEPGLVPPHRWRPDPVVTDIGAAPATTLDDTAAPVWAGVAVKRPTTVPSPRSGDSRRD
ncbi:SAM-dependent methyltransferase [Streptomyces montanisoli]|uniref:SAM-dependent methyltransferase n=1 Tax=Streptomyces montanisoli TaxID=2798581 RepID=A0A940MA60_9ACTN|nr:SAM-dependent methyltransferase [Streptomyces montanisoli]MBP0457579.1 SAM-dependent methyltransferase [Streptomyces montanisoli]